METKLSLFIIKTSQIIDQKIYFNSTDAYHLHRVLRKVKNDIIRCQDNLGNIYKCRLTEFNEDSAVAVITEKSSKKITPIIPITLIFPLLKGKKTELIIQKATELGIDRFIPFLYKRTVVKPDNEKKISRYTKIIHESCKQSERIDKPELLNIHTLSDLKETLKQNINDLRLILWEENKNNHIKNILKHNQKVNNIYIAIGPEGGIEKNEINSFIDLNFEVCNLGTNILRSETACISSISMCIYEYY